MTEWCYSLVLQYPAFRKHTYSNKVHLSTLLFILIQYFFYTFSSDILQHVLFMVKEANKKQ
jgi:hypothetical protein